MHRSTALLAALAVTCGAARPQSGPLTVPEATDWKKTSAHADVLAFLDQLKKLPHADRLAFSSIGRSGEGRDLALVVASNPGVSPEQVRASGKLRILVNANIHGGEVEGKEAAQILLREIALGEHTDLLRDAVLLFVPDFNPDGNDAFGPAARNRREQVGPDPVGQRHNAADLDLNRDFVKAESPEVQALLGAFARYDPHLFMDLHTTDGSYHGYHLTYATSLSPNVDPALTALARDTLLPEIRAAMLSEHGYRIFDYGNFSRRGTHRWTTYDHRPRYGTNYYGLRNRLAVLSEAYSHLDFEQRIAVTRAFVLETVRAVERHAGAVRAACAEADARPSAKEPLQFGYDTALAPPVEQEVLVGSVSETKGPDGETYLRADDTHHGQTMPTQLAFEARAHRALPAAWALPAPQARVRELLQRHGIRVLHPHPGSYEVREFVPDAVEHGGSSYDGPSVLIRGHDHMRILTLSADALLVPADQPLARLAAELLEPVSEDSLATNGVFGDRVVPPDRLARMGLRYPVVRLAHCPPTAGDDTTGPAPRQPLPAEAPAAAGVIVLDIICDQFGQQHNGQRQGHRVHWRLGEQVFEDLPALAERLSALAKGDGAGTTPPALEIRAHDGTVYTDVATMLDTVRKAGFEQIRFGNTPGEHR